MFFFFDTEWVRIALPIVSATTVPSSAFQSYVLKALPTPQLVSFYQKMFSLYRNTQGTPVAVLGCPLDNGSGCANRQSISHSSDDSEQVQTARIDYNINQQDTAWSANQADTGLQAAYTGPINPVFDSFSPQPLYSFAAGYTHVFSQNLVNYFNPALSWYKSLFSPTDFPSTLRRTTTPLVV